MLRVTILFLALFLAPCLASAQSAELPHLFDDLNANGISDADENLEEMELPDTIDATELPPTPEDADILVADEGNGQDPEI